jgi:hypothetical protein
MLYGSGKVRIRIGGREGEEDAKIVALALKPDDAEWTEARSEGDELILEVKTPKIGAMINAYDDYFLNLIAASSVLEALKGD